MNDRSIRRATRFERFIRRMGVDGVRRALGSRGIAVTARAVYQWRSGTTVPRPNVAGALVAISGGTLRNRDDIYRHREFLLMIGGIDGSAGNGHRAGVVAGGAEEGPRRE